MTLLVRYLKAFVQDSPLNHLMPGEPDSNRQFLFSIVLPSFEVSAWWDFRDSKKAKRPLLKPEINRGSNKCFPYWNLPLDSP